MKKILLAVGGLLFSTNSFSACALPSCVASDPKLDQVITAINAGGGGGGGSSNIATWNGFTVNLGIGNTGTGTLRTVLASDQPAIPVTQSGTWNISNVSGTISLPTGASTSVLQTSGNASLSNIDTKTPSLVSGRQPVDGSGVTQPISASALPLPSGASTAAKQPAIGVAGIPSSDVITVQGVTSMIALKTDSSATTQPISASTLPLPSGASTNTGITGGKTLADVWGILSFVQDEAGVSPPNAIAVQGTAGMIPVQISGSISPPTYTINDISGTITTGGTSQTLRSADSSDREIEVYNNSSTEALCIKYGATASTTASGNICIQPLGLYSNKLTNQRVDVIAVTTGHVFTANVRQ